MHTHPPIYPLNHSHALTPFYHPAHMHMRTYTYTPLPSHAPFTPVGESLTSWPVEKALHVSCTSLKKLSTGRNSRACSPNVMSMLCFLLPSARVAFELSVNFTRYSLSPCDTRTHDTHTQHTHQKKPHTGIHARVNFQFCVISRQMDAFWQG